MHFAIVNAPPGSTGKPYRFYKFKTLNAAHKCPEVDEFALVYESQEQLQQLCPMEDIRAVLISLGIEVPESVTHAALANALHKLTEKNATSWSSEKAEETTLEEEPEEMASIKKAAKKSAAPKKAKAKKAAPVKKERKVPLQAKLTGRMQQTGKIKVLGKNPAREGTNRYDNLAVILASKTVEEALRNLRNLPKPGGMVDIRFALANGLIEVQSNG